MKVKKTLLLLIFVLLLSTLSQAEVVEKRHRNEVLQVVRQLAEMPGYVNILHYPDLSRMEFAVVIGRLLMEHPGLRIKLSRPIGAFSWELTKLGYRF